MWSSDTAEVFRDEAFAAQWGTYRDDQYPPHRKRLGIKWHNRPDEHGFPRKAWLVVPDFLVESMLNDMLTALRHRREMLGWQCADTETQIAQTQAALNELRACPVSAREP